MNFDRSVVDLLKKGAKAAFDRGEVPVCAIVFDKAMNVVSCCSNNRQESGFILGHAEVLAILEAEKVVGDWRLNGYSMLVNLEPCMMCSAVIKESRLDQVFFLVEKPDIDCNIVINKSCLDGYEEDKVYFKNLLTDFFDNMR